MERKDLRIDLRRESYRSFFDHAWAERVLDLSRGTPFSSNVFDLCAAWRGAANTHVLPYLMVSSIKSSSDGFAKGSNPFGKRWIAAIREGLVNRMGDSLRNMQRKKMQQVLDTMYNEIESLPDGTFPFTEDQIWDSFLPISEFQFSLWGSQRICYAAVYYAYENFVATCVAIARNESDYETPPHNQFIRDFADAYNEQLCNRCWNHKTIFIPRLVRHALVHNGGRVTKKLAKYEHGLMVDNGELQIMAHNTTDLFNSLKQRAEQMLTGAIEHLSVST